MWKKHKSPGDIFVLFTVKRLNKDLFIPFLWLLHWWFPNFHRFNFHSQVTKTASYGIYLSIKINGYHTHFFIEGKNLSHRIYHSRHHGNDIKTKELFFNFTVKLFNVNVQYVTYMLSGSNVWNRKQSNNFIEKIQAHKDKINILLPFHFDNLLFTIEIYIFFGEKSSN